MSWVVLGEKNGKIQLVSKSSVTGLLPKGSYLTVQEGQTKFILRVDESEQNEPYAPSPLIVDMDLTALQQDRKCQNIIYAYRVKDLTKRKDGMIDYIKPQSIARRSTQEEVDIAMSSDDENGPRVFLATIHASQNQLLIDEGGHFVTAKLPKDMFFHQMLICGKTGSGKTVAMKYLAQFFTEEFDGAVLMINVKEADFLTMNRPSRTKNQDILKEWEMLGNKAHGVDNFTVYYPANVRISSTKQVDLDMTRKITLSVKDIEPESLIGLLQGLTDIGAQNLPNIFRFWQEERRNDKKQDNFTFNEFANYFSRAEDNKIFKTLNSRGDESEVKLHSGTFDSIKRTLDSVAEFFDNTDAECLNHTDILQSGKMSVIDVAVKNGIQFGSILLRNLLHKIVTAKSEGSSKVPMLIIIDEVHRFYDSAAAEGALGDLDTICRTGRSQEIGIIFSSQNPTDIPTGLASVVNTKIFFKTDASVAKLHGLAISSQEMESLKKGFAVTSIHELSQAKILKFPLSYAGVVEKGAE